MVNSTMTTYAHHIILDPAHQPAFSTSFLQIMQRLRGDLPLPWEGDLSLDIRRRLGSFKGLILQLLDRDPVLRITMRSFHHACDRLFAERTTVEA